jgi:zinc D-Ala-D-Ala carboxypeptidase
MLRKKRYLLPLVFCLAVAAVFLSLNFAELNVYGQSGAALAPEPEKREFSAPRPAPEKSAAVNLPAASKAPAVAENLQLKETMSWTFGGKQQRGWALYVLLIQKTLGTESAVETAEFAAAVADWQSRHELAPSGVVDQETLGRLIKFWQSQRLNSSQYPAEEQLLTAPVASFYDSSRPADLLKVQHEAYAAYRKMIEAARSELQLKIDARGDFAPDEPYLKIISAFRSREYQAGLRAASPNSGRAGLAVNSPHFTGNALDIYVGGEPVSTADANRALQVRTPAYRWLVKNAARFGFYPYFYEPWHWEYVKR